MRWRTAWIGTLALTCALLAGGYEPARADGEPAGRAEDRYRRILERLEAGIAALEELGRRDALDVLRRVREDVLREQAAARDGRPGEGGDDPALRLEDLANRLAILRHAREVQAEAGRGDAAEVLAQAVRLAESQAEGVPAQPPEGFSMASVVEHLRGAARLYDRKGWERRTAACRALADFYARRMQAEDDEDDEDDDEEGDAEGDAEDEAEDGDDEEDGPGDDDSPPAGRSRREGGPDLSYLEDRATRLEILHLARAAHGDAGHADAVEQMDRILRLGRLQLEGAAAEEIARASEGLSQEATIDLVRRAADLYRDRKDPKRETLCRELAEFYVRRAGAGAAARTVEPAAAGQAAAVEGLRRELEALRAELERLMAEMARRGR